MVVAFLTGDARVKKHPKIMGLFNGDPNCRFESLRLKWFTLLSAAARLWLASTIISLESSVQNLKI